MKNMFLSVLAATLFSGTAALAQYRMEPVTTPAPDLAPAYAAVLQSQGFKVVDGSGKTFCEVWFRKSLPVGPKSMEGAVAFPTIPHGSLLGVLRFPERGADRRGQTIKPGVYTLRYSLYPINGDHQGVAPQRDFAVLSPAADDKDPNATPAYDPLMDMSRKASGTPHPAVLEIGPPADGVAFPSLTPMGDHDWLLNVKIGDTPLYLLVVGKSEA
jgi:hypothetical protein